MQSASQHEASCPPARLYLTVVLYLQDDGFVAKLLVPDGQKDLAVGAPMLILVEDEGDVSKFADYNTSQEAKGEDGNKSADSQAPAESQETPPGTVRCSPFAYVAVQASIGALPIPWRLTTCMPLQALRVSQHLLPRARASMPA